MLTDVDEIKAIVEPKSARMEQRTKPHVKKQIQAAAALLGIDETAFVTSAAYAQARAVIEDHQRTRLAPADRDLLLGALGTPDEPNEALREAFVLHRQMAVNGN